MTWRVAKSLKILLAQINKRWPERDKSSDGTIGDAQHSSRSSDHNPNNAGVVCALDITNDPFHGLQSNTLATALANSRDPRIKYIISNGLIISSTTSPWKWRKYTGANPHTKHFHISVEKDYDDETPWSLDGVLPKTLPNPPAKPRLKRGSRGGEVEELQALLKIEIDGRFGPATEAAVKAFQIKKGLVADGIVGPYTWGVLKGETK